MKDGSISSISGESLSGNMVMHHTTDEDYEAIDLMRYRFHEVATRSIRILL